MYSISTKDGAAAEFWNSIYVLDQRCWGVRYDIWGSGPHGWDAVHFVYSLKKQKREAKVYLLLFFSTESERASEATAKFLHQRSLEFMAYSKLFISGSTCSAP